MKTIKIDLTELNNIADGDDEFKKTAISILLSEIPESINSISQYASEKDMLAVQKTVHKMRSSFMYIGVKGLLPVINSIERPESPENVWEQVPELVKICNEAVAQLRAI